ncbi:MAG: YtxH domain-containing protein [Myxococcales bacterium]|nr:YtxH domain-containing protein [Myxococcales bacterium]MCB9736011.1 YtxH domain-containing protein [Deltaproteobacteria bacterium]
MNFNELVEQARDSFKNISSERFLESLGLQTIPTTASRVLPLVAAFGAGAVLGSAATFIFTPKSGTETRETIVDFVQKLVKLAKREAEDVKDKAESVKDGAEEKVASAKDKITELKDKVVDKAKSIASEAKSKAKDAASEAKSKAKDASSKMASA